HPGYEEIAAQRLAHGYGDRLGGTPRVLVALRIADESEHLFAALRGYQVSPAAGRAQPLRTVHEELVAGGVAESVVHQLEVIEVDVQHRQAAAGTAGVRDRRHEMLVERRPVGQVREAVVIGEMLEARSRLSELVGGTATLRDVGDDPVHPDHAVLDARPGSLPPPP